MPLSRNAMAIPFDKNIVLTLSFSSSANRDRRRQCGPGPIIVTLPPTP
jgi:hypothetical protein